jgi:hypothetical protein
LEAPAAPEGPTAHLPPHKQADGDPRPEGIQTDRVLNDDSRRRQREVSLQRR